MKNFKLLQHVSLSSILVVFLASIPCFLLFKGMYSTVQQAEAITQDFRPAATPTPRPTCVETTVKEPVPGFIPTALEVPSLQLHTSLIPDASPYNFKPVAIDSVYYALNTSRVNSSKGRVVIYAKDGTIDHWKNKQIKPGDQLLLSSKEETAVYEVSPNTGTVEDIMNPFKDSQTPTLSVVTTKDTFYFRDNIMLAKLISIHTNCNETR